jgi:hypothetical protein
VRSAAAGCAPPSGAAAGVAAAAASRAAPGRPQERWRHAAWLPPPPRLSTAMRQRQIGEEKENMQHTLELTGAAAQLQAKLCLCIVPQKDWKASLQRLDATISYQILHL